MSTTTTIRMVVICFLQNIHRGTSLPHGSLGIYLVLPMASGWLVGIAVAIVQAAFFSDANPSPGALWAASTRAEAGFMLSTIDVGIRIVVPRSFVVS